MEPALVDQPPEELAPAPAAVIAAAGGGPRERRPDRAPIDLAALSRGVALGDERALAALYDLWFERAVRLAGSIVRRTPLARGGEEACLDIVQDAFVRIARSMKPMPGNGDVERWIVRVVKSAALDHLRREARRARRDERRAQREGDRAADASAAAELAEQVAWLRTRLDELDDDERGLLGLRFGTDRTLDEAGAATGITGDAAHGKLRRVLKRLRDAAGSVFP